MCVRTCCGLNIDGKLTGKSDIIFHCVVFFPQDVAVTGIGTVTLTKGSVEVIGKGTQFTTQFAEPKVCFCLCGNSRAVQFNVL